MTIRVVTPNCIPCTPCHTPKALGLGRRLTAALAEELQARGFQSLALWVLDVNPTRAFYLHLGGREAGEKIETIPGGELREIRLVWDDLASLVAG